MSQPVYALNLFNVSNKDEYSYNWLLNDRMRLDYELAGQLPELRT